MKALTIEQVQNVLDWSYPTALKFAQENGQTINGGRKWAVAADIVLKVIEEREQVARDMRQRFTMELANNGTE